FSFHAQCESRLSLTGSKADLRLRIAPGDVGSLVAQLAQRIAARAGVPLDAGDTPASSVAPEVLDDLADKLWQARRQGLVVCGSQDVAVQVLVNFLNETLGSYGTTLDLKQPLPRQESDAQLYALLEELRGGRVGALFLLDCNPVYDLPGGE